MNSRPTMALALATFLTSLTALTAQQAAPGGPVEVAAIVAKVNGRVVTNNEVNMMLGPEYARLVAQFPRRGPAFEKQFNEAREAIIQELIDRQIILDEFKRSGFSIPPSAVDEEVKNQMRSLYNGDEVKFREELKKSRMTMEGYREMTRERMVVSAMRNKQFSDGPPPLPSEIQKYYNEIKPTLRDTSKDQISFKKIFIPMTNYEDPSSTPDSQLTLAEDLAEQIKKGADFAELAKKHSADGFAETGGYQEKVNRIDLSPEFAAILFEAPDGQLVGPLLDPAGFTLVIPTKKFLGPSPALEGRVREMVEEQVRTKKKSADYERWIEARRKRAIIVPPRPSSPKRQTP
jgi:peptidyl-prolyl cis-trans isomerase SurA